MARKNSAARKAADEAYSAETEDSMESVDTRESAPPAAEEAPVAKARSKVADDSSSTGSVGLSDIRKAVAFANSVGGLDKAIALLQIVKVAKEVQ